MKRVKEISDLLSRNVHRFITFAYTGNRKWFLNGNRINNTYMAREYLDAGQGHRKLVI